MRLGKEAPSSLPGLFLRQGAQQSLGLGPCLGLRPREVHQVSTLRETASLCRDRQHWAVGVGCGWSPGRLKRNMGGLGVGESLREDEYVKSFEVDLRNWRGWLWQS